MILTAGKLWALTGGGVATLAAAAAFINGVPQHKSQSTMAASLSYADVEQQEAQRDKAAYEKTEAFKSKNCPVQSVSDIGNGDERLDCGQWGSLYSYGFRAKYDSDYVTKAYVFEQAAKVKAHLGLTADEDLSFTVYQPMRPEDKVDIMALRDAQPKPLF